MHITSLAPVLSATSSRVCIWIIGQSTLASQWSRRFVSGQYRRDHCVTVCNSAADRHLVRTVNSDVLAASSSPARACWAPGRTIRTIRQRLSLDRGRVSMISTTSPMCDALASSCAWQTVRRRSILPYLGCGTSRSTTTRRVLLILSDVTIPISVLRRVRAWSSGYGLGLLDSSGFLMDLIMRLVQGSRPVVDLRNGSRTRPRLSVAAARSLLSLDLAVAEDRLDPGDLALGLDDLAGGLEPLGLALEAEAEQVVLNFSEQQVELLVGLFAEFGGLADITSNPLFRLWAGG